jgi:hypothetical protein
VDDSATHILIAIGSMVFTAGGFFIYTKMSITHLEQWGQENHDRLDKKIDKNFETLDAKIKENQVALLADISGVGSKVGREQRDAARRYHNLTTAVILAAPPAKEQEIAEMLREGS